MSSVECSSEGQQFYAAMTRNIGELVLKMLPICDRLGWASAQAALPYLHATSVSSGVFIDFVRFATGSTDEDVLTRLRDVAAAWGFDKADIAPSALEAAHH